MKLTPKGAGALPVDRSAGERHDDRRIAGLARDCGAEMPGNSSASSVCAASAASIPSRARAHVLGAVGLIARAVALHVHRIRDIELSLTELEASLGLVRRVPRAQLRQRPDRRRWPERREPAIEVALHPVTQHDRAVRSSARCRAPSRSATRQVLLRDRGDSEGMSAGSTTVAPARRSAVAAAHDQRCGEPASRSRDPGSTAR